MDFGWKTYAVLLGGFVAVIWGLEIIDLMPMVDLDTLGVQPRSVHGLTGIIAMPFLHGGFAHLAANTGSFLILGGVLLASAGPRRFIFISVATSVLAASAIWLLGRPGTNHIGASAMIFGYFGYLLVYGFVRRDIKSLVVSLVIGAIYGGLVFGVLPGQPGVSWEGHLFGFLAGGALAFVLGRGERRSAAGRLG